MHYLKDQHFLQKKKKKKQIPINLNKHERKINS